MARVLIGIPTYLGQMHARVAHSLIRCSAKSHWDLAEVDSSACAMTMNTLWIQAIEMAEAGHIDRFLMLHSDIAAENYFLDKMVDIMDRTGADVLSAIVPIKDNFGYTSTALDEQMGDVDPKYRVRRLTMHEVHNNYP